MQVLLRGAGGRFLSAAQRAALLAQQQARDAAAHARQAPEEPAAQAAAGDGHVSDHDVDGNGVGDMGRLHSHRDVSPTPSADRRPASAGDEPLLGSQHSARVQPHAGSASEANADHAVGSGSFGDFGMGLPNDAECTIRGQRQQRGAAAPEGGPAAEGRRAEDAASAEWLIDRRPPAGNGAATLFGMEYGANGAPFEGNGRGEEVAIGHGNRNGFDAGDLDGLGPDHFDDAQMDRLLTEFGSEGGVAFA